MIEQAVIAMILGIVPLLLIVAVDGGLESNVDHAGARDSGDQLQEEILAAMKDSGVLDEWKEKLDDMLYNEIDDTNTAEKQQKKKLPVINEQEREMLRSFIEEYKSDSNLKVSTELILGIIDRVQKTPKPNLPQIFVQLGPVIDVISAIAEKTKDVQKIIDRQGPIFDSPAKPKDILHTLAENLKSELVRLRPQQQKQQQKAKASSGGGLGLSDYLTLGSTLLKGGNGAQLMSLLSGDADISSLIQLLPQLIEQGEYKSLLGKMVNSYLSSSPLGAMAASYLGQVLDTEDGEKFLSGLFTTLEEFVKSKSYERLSGIVPKIMAAKDTEAVLKVLTTEVENNWDLFFNSIKNEDYKENFLDSFASFVVQGLDFYEGIPANSMLSQASLVVNGFLMANKLPSYSARKPVESVTKIAVKAWKLYSPARDSVDLAPILQAVTEAVAGAWQAQSRGNSFASLSSKEKAALISRLVDAELVSPVQAVWAAYTKAQAEATCAQHLLCLVNAREVRTASSAARAAVVKGASLVAGWALAGGSKERYWGLYKATHAGGSGEDCTVTYPVPGHSCDTFPWQTADMMNTQYDHIEL